MAGANSGFDAGGFREGIRFAMEMGAAPDAGERVTFHFPSQLIYNDPAPGVNDGIDAIGVPFDPHYTVTQQEPPAVQVDCAVEYFDAENQPTDFGLLAPTRIAVTLLDEDYDQVKGTSYVVAGGDKYEYRRTEPPLGMFDVGVYIMHFVSPSDT